jgi:hypothetical protein
MYISVGTVREREKNRKVKKNWGRFSLVELDFNPYAVGSRTPIGVLSDFQNGFFFR